MLRLRNSLVLAFALIVGQGMTGCSKEPVASGQAVPQASVPSASERKMKEAVATSSATCIGYIHAGHEEYGSDLDAVLFDHDERLELQYQEIDRSEAFYLERAVSAWPEKSSELIRDKMISAIDLLETEQGITQVLEGVASCVRGYRALLRPAPTV